MPTEKLLPIKVVFPRKTDYVSPPPGGGNWDPFTPVTDELRSEFSGQVAQLQQYFQNAFAEEPNVPAVAKVQLRSEAVAKTYRPTDLFNSDTCPIIGSNKLGELYVSVQPQGLKVLNDKIEHSQTKKTIAHLSTLNKITPYSANDALGSRSAAELRKDSAKTKLKGLRLRLFRHADAAANQLIDAAFERLVKNQQVRDSEVVEYAEGVKVYRVAAANDKAIVALASFPGTQSLSVFPDYRIVRTASRVIGNVSAVTFPPPDPKIDYPLVGIIDSGTDRTNAQLQTWVADRYDWVPAARQNNDHGSFVAGLLVHSQRLNNGDQRFPLASSKIVDVVALDKDGEISEYDLLTVFDEALERFPSVRIWNLSLGMVGAPCVDSEFSLLASALDERARKSNVLFVVASGNYTASPFRSWPPSEDDEIGEEDRICPPADSVRAITVGSLAHIANASSRVQSNEPSPFSRRGPGPAYLLKPELVHFGGNCAQDGQYIQTGVISVDGSGHIAENIGTSFATPLVSTVAANVHHELTTDEGTVISTSLTKALMLHGAFIRNTPLDASTINYVGLGTPDNVEPVVNCSKSSATIIIQAPVQASPEFGKRPFPIPACFSESGKLVGEIFMTLLYDPPLDRSFGIEYCRCNVSASLGTISVDPKTGKDKYDRQVSPVPKELTDGYEAELIKHGYKWAPLKLYYRKFSQAAAGRDWRLTLDVLNRSETLIEDPQDVTLIITVRANSDLVYDQMVQSMLKLNWGAQDLKVRSRIRLQS